MREQLRYLEGERDSKARDETRNEDSRSPDTFPATMPGSRGCARRATGCRVCLRRALDWNLLPAFVPIAPAAPAADTIFRCSRGCRARRISRLPALPAKKRTAQRAIATHQACVP